MLVFKPITTNTKVCNDPEGLIRALLTDLPNEGDGLDYDEWITLVSLLKHEIEDECTAFEIFEEFSKKSDLYNEEFTRLKFYDAGFEGTGQVSLGSLIFFVRRDINDFSMSNYAKYYSNEKVSVGKAIRKQLKANKDKVPDHILVDPVEPTNMPDVRVEPELALINILIEGETYATATHPSRESIVSPFDGDSLQQYITVNPVKTKRKQSNVTNFRYAVVEFDTISLDEQWSILSCVDLPYEALIFTGGKSIHAWIRIDAPDLETYKKRTRLIGKMFEDFGYTKENNNKVDTSVLYDCSSLVRTAGVLREPIKDSDEHTRGTEQKVLWTEKSKGWDDWYENTYPKYVVLDSLSDTETEKPFAVPQKSHNFMRVSASLYNTFGADFMQELFDALEGCEPELIPNMLDEAVTGLFQEVRKKTKIALSTPDLYHMLEVTTVEAGNLYVGDIREALLSSCSVAEKYEEIRRKEVMERLEGHFTDRIEAYGENWDIELLNRMQATLDAKMDTGEGEYEKVLLSIIRTLEETAFRSVVLQSAEVHRYAKNAGQAVSKALDIEGNKGRGAIYKYRGRLSYLDSVTKCMEEVTVPLYHSVISPFLAFVKQKASGEFHVVPLDNDSTNKLLCSTQFLNCFREVEFLSDVPVFNPSDGSLILGYNADFKVLVTGSTKGYKIMGLSKAKETLKALFNDFLFVSPADKARAMSCLLMPAMAHADMLHGDSRPIVYVDADGQGAGKGTLIKFLVFPYTEKSPFISQDDSSIGSLDEKIGCTVADGHNHIILDNLKPTKKMKEFSSPFVESMLTTSSVQFRSAGMKRQVLDVSKSVLYVTTNGMSLSKDMAARSLFISIRKQPNTHVHKDYAGGLDRYLINNRPEIMSAIYTILKEYVDMGSPILKPKEGHRFLYSVPILNYVVSEILGMGDISLGLSDKNTQKSDTHISAVRKICFEVENSGRLDEELSSVDLFEILNDRGEASLLDLDNNIELWSDEACTVFSMEGKRAIGMEISKLMSRHNILKKKPLDKSSTSCSIEEFEIFRTYSASSGAAQYKITK